MKKAICLILIALILTACKTKTIYVPVESIKTEYRDRLQRDSIHLYDSVFVEKWKTNDTVFLTKEKYKYLYRDRLSTDTIISTDSVQIPYPVIEIKEVNKLMGYQNFLIWCGAIALIGLLGGIGFKLLKPKI